MAWEETGLLYSELAKNGNKLDAIFTSLQRRVFETWDDEIEFSLWTNVNCEIFSSVLLGTSTIETYNIGAITTDTVTGVIGSGIKIKVNSPCRITQVIPLHQNMSSPTMQIFDILKNQVIYSTDASGSGVLLTIDVSLDIGEYYLDIYSSSGDTSYNRYESSDPMVFPITIGDLEIQYGYSSRNTNFSGITPDTDDVYSFRELRVTKLVDGGITDGNIISPLIDSRSIINYDFLDALIVENDGSYQVDILDSSDVVLLSDVKKTDYLNSLSVENIKIKISLSRILSTNISPEIRSVTLAYIK